MMGMGRAPAVGVGVDDDDAMFPAVFAVRFGAAAVLLYRLGSRWIRHGVAVRATTAWSLRQIFFWHNGHCDLRMLYVLTERNSCCFVQTDRGGEILDTNYNPESSCKSLLTGPDFGLRIPSDKVGLKIVSTLSCLLCVFAQDSSTI
jgi:hypothetical protein